MHFSHRAAPGAVIVLCVSFCSATHSAEAPSAEPAEVLDTVTITASPIGDGDSLATLVETVDREDLLRSGAASLGDALSHVPGVSGSGFAPGASRPIIRGFDSSRVRVLENGLGSFDVADVGPDHGVPIDPLGADKIEILRGPGTLRYGSQAIGGVVNTLNQRVPTRLPAETPQGEVAFGLGSAADSREISGQLGGALGDWALHGDGFRRKLEDYDSPRGEQLGTWYDGKGGSLGASRIYSQGYAGAAIVHYDATYGLPGEDTFIDMRQNKLLVRAALEPQGSAVQRLTLDAGYGDYQHSERQPDGLALAEFADKEWESRFEASFGATGPLSAAAVGLQFQHRAYSALGEAADYLLPTTTRNAALFAFGEAELGARARMQFGARVEHVAVSGTGRDDAPVEARFTPLSASVGAVFDAATGVQLGLTASSSARGPAQTELFARGPHDGPQTFELGDANLGIERADSLEGTLHWRRDGTHVETAVWNSWHQGFIHGAFTGRLCDETGDCAANGPGDLRELSYGASDARFRGVEFVWEQRLARVAGGELSSRLSGDAVRAHFVDGGDVPRIPPWRLGIGLDFDAASWRFSADLRHAGSQEHPGALDTPTPGYTSLDASASWHAPTAHDVEVTLLGRNLTDSEQRNAASFNKDTLLMPGRDVRLLVRVKL